MILTLQKLLQKSKQVSDLRDAHALALDLMESMLRHYAVVAIAAYRHGGASDAKVNRILLEQLPRPSMGSWKNFLQVLAHADPHIFPESFWDKFLQPLTKKISNPDIVSAYAGLQWLTDQDVFSSHVTSSIAESAPCTPLEFFDAAVVYRNRFAGHGTHELPDSAITFAPLFLKGAVALCNHLNALWLACPVYVAKQAKLYGRTFFRLTPLVEAEGIGELQAATPGMEEDRLYICFGDKKHPEVESLYPAALWEENDILFANGTKGLIDIHYIGYASQRSFETSIYEEDFRAFLTPFAQLHISDEHEPTAPPAQAPFNPVQLSQAKGKWKLVMVSIGVMLLFIAAAIGYLRFVKKGDQEIKSVAVLPFRNMSSDKDQDYFCDGVAEEILNALSSIENLKVIARPSSFAFRGDAVDIAEVGRKLKVESILEGSVRKADNIVRITAQLIRVSDQSNLWSKPFERDLRDLNEMFDFQEEIARSVVNELQVKIAKNEKAAIEAHPTNNQEAYNYYLQANYYYQRGGQGDREKVFDYCRKAIELDPEFADAHLGMAFFYAVHEDLLLAKKFLDRALLINDRLPRAYVLKAWINSQYEWNFSTAENNFKKALSMNPRLPEAYTWYAQHLRVLGKYEQALREIEVSREVDPLNLDMYGESMAIYIDTNEFGKAKEFYEKAREINPDAWYPQEQWGRLCYLEGKYEEALNTFHKLNITKKNLYMGITYGFKGDREQAERIITEIMADATNSSKNINIAYIYAALGDINSAFNWLEKALKNREHQLVWLKTEPEWRKLRSDQRFNILLKQIGLTAD